MDCPPDKKLLPKPKTAQGSLIHSTCLGARKLFTMLFSCNQIRVNIPRLT